jgi:hypothetical protein
MVSRRSQRIRKPTVIWEAAEDLTPHGRKKKTQKASKIIKKEALTFILVEPIFPSITRELLSYTTHQ